jgi:ABC-2 type transport system ATP-binding protein
VLQIEHLRKTYGPVTALEDVSLEVRPGEIVGFVGSNGAGKSTTMRIAMGVVAQDQGTVRWRGEPVTFATRRRFGYMPEQRGLYPKMRIKDQVAYFAKLHGVGTADADAAAQRLLERMQVAAEPNAFLQTLSLGNQQRVQLASALVHDPELVILDEPFSGLDPLGVDTMAEVLQECTRAGLAVLFSSHQLELVERLCDRITIIRSGRVIAQGTLEELRRAKGSRELQVRVDGAASGWIAAVPGARVASDEQGLLTIGLDDPGLDQQVLAAAAQAGRVVSFGWRQPPLSQLYRDAIAEAA